MVTKFKNYLIKQDMAPNSITSYVWTVNYFLKKYGEVKKSNLLTYNGYLVENYSPQTVNLRLQGINKYLEFRRNGQILG